MKAKAQKQDQALKLPFKVVDRVPGEEKKVSIFFSAFCSFCAEYHRTLANWGGSLPADWSARFIPIITADREDTMAAIAYYAVALSDPGKLIDFMEMTYQIMTIDKSQANNPRIWSDIAQRAGVSRFESSVRLVSKSMIMIAAEKTVRYAISETPTVGIAGRYTVSPENAGGDKKEFIKLLNGVVSKAMIEK